MNKFKIGDNVKTIYNCGYHIPGFKLGIISKITDISEDNNFKASYQELSEPLGSWDELTQISVCSIISLDYSI